MLCDTLGGSRYDANMIAVMEASQHRQHPPAGDRYLVLAHGTSWTSRAEDERCKDDERFLSPQTSLDTKQNFIWSFVLNLAQTSSGPHVIREGQRPCPPSVK